MTTPSSVPQGEAESPWIDPIRDPLSKLLELADESDGACYGTLSTRIARDLITEALAALDRARALVAASPCAAELVRIAPDPPERECPHCELPALRSCGKHCPMPDVPPSFAAAQGGQQPAAPAPAAPLTAERIDELLLSIGTTGKRQVWFTRAEAIAAVKAAHGITLAGTAQKESEHG